MAIEAYWGLSEKPFLNTPDTRYIFESDDFVEAMGRILYNLQEIKGGITLVVGEIGCGKTILIHALRAKLPGEQYACVSLINPRMSPNQLLGTIASGFGVVEVPRLRNKVLDVLLRTLTEKNRAGVTPVLLIDEAQTITPLLLEEIRLLLNFEDPKKKLLQIVLFGQPELKKKIRGIEQLNQRINIRYHLKGLNLEEAAAYVQHRLKIAGARKPVFSDAAVGAIHRHARGIPRLINTIATNAMYAGAMMKVSLIEPDVIKEAIEDGD